MLRSTGPLGAGSSGRCPTRPWWAFIRITTRAGIMRRPLTPIVAYVQS
jgi:hypothetical protein